MCATRWTTRLLNTLRRIVIWSDWIDDCMVAGVRTASPPRRHISCVRGRGLDYRAASRHVIRVLLISDMFQLIAKPTARWTSQGKDILLCPWLK
jgi:hypothetical protein